MSKAPRLIGKTARMSPKTRSPKTAPMSPRTRSSPLEGMPLTMSKTKGRRQPLHSEITSLRRAKEAAEAAPASPAEVEADAEEAAESRAEPLDFSGDGRAAARQDGAAVEDSRATFDDSRALDDGMPDAELEPLM